MQELSDLWNATFPHAVNISGDFSPREFPFALHHLKPSKASGPDSIFPELLIYAGSGLKSWLRGFLSSCLRQLKIPKIWRRALVVAIPKPSKSEKDTQSYRLCSALCSLKDPRTTNLQSCRTNSRIFASKVTGWIINRKVYHGPGSFAFAKH